VYVEYCIPYYNYPIGSLGPYTPYIKGVGCLQTLHSRNLLHRKGQMKTQAAEQMFDTGSFLLWMNVHDGLIFLITDKETWRGWPDKWDGKNLPIDLVEFPVERGFAYLVRKANLLPAIGLPIEGEHPYQALCEEHPDGWVITDFYGRTLELRPDMTWHVAEWPAMQKPEWV